MPELIETGHNYVAQAPLFKVKRSKREEYIKDERSMVRYLMRQATSDMKVASTKTGVIIEGRELARSLEQMVELKRYCEKLVRRLGNDEHLLYLLLEVFGGGKGILRENNTTLKGIFQDSEGEKIARVEKFLDGAGYKTDLYSAKDHSRWEIESNAEGG